MSLKHKNEYRNSIENYLPIKPVRRKIGLYWILAVLRIALTLVPQTGYIHPDEFFQSIEVISGDHFDIDINRPWEFNSTFPIRTAFVPKLIVGLPYTFLKILSPYVFYYFNLSLRTPYFYVLFPRLFMCMLSFLSDYFLYKICCIYGQNYRVRLVTYASSYIMITYATRTLSNAIELVLTAALLYFTSQCMAVSEKVVFQSDFLAKKHSEAKPGVERVKYHKFKALLPSHSLNHCFILATITIVGIFNRPTFIAFAFAPVFFWLQRGLGSRTVGFIDFHIRIFYFIFCGLPAALFFIIVDSFYFGYLTVQEIGKMEIGMNNFVVTPLNFLRYNMNTKNLATHGLHPQFLHVLVNIPLLFSVLGIVALWKFAKMVNSVRKAQWLQLPRLQSIVGLMTCTFIVPIVLLSLFPHQEPRFIIPVLFPLVFLYAPELSQVPSLDIVPRFVIDKNDNSSKSCGSTSSKRQESKPRKLVFWYVSNLLLALFYAFAHQGGIFQLTSHVATELKAKPHLTHLHLYTSYSYPLPTSLLQLRNTNRINFSSGNNHKYKLVQVFYLYEQGSKPLSRVLDDIVWRIRDCENKFIFKKIPYRMYYALPASALAEFTELLRGRSHLFDFRVVKTFYPHISTERLPSLPSFERLENLLSLQLDRVSSNCIEVAKNIYDYAGQFKLLLLKIELPTINQNRHVPSKTEQEKK
ncbi:GPI mannosyltransferase 4 [Harpegnathos saltator]|uniref:Mannosyltransferase n=1 Tax=Harpegnathos saltator TaxID=610380 RepID=E2B7T6_HARSA|nr:GPI mannosyltransferase 4 [Harpegnathos saltator]EFN88229.1 GPI mannosyltransferase 4 [Harpegnathos saltator]